MLLSKSYALFLNLNVMGIRAAHMLVKTKISFRKLVQFKFGFPDSIMIKNGLILGFFWCEMILRLY